MLNGEKIVGCDMCYQEEKASGNSLRTHSNECFPVENPEPNARLEDVEYLEIFVGSVCNLKCVSCSPRLSTQVKADYQKLGWKIPDDKIKLPNRLDFVNRLQNLKKIKFVGGEPLLNSLHDQVIDTIGQFETSELTLVYYTNCMVWPRPEILELWDSSGGLELNLSIDAIGDKNEYLRMNSRWDLVEEIVERYFEYGSTRPHVKIQLSSSVSQLNLLYLKEIDDWFNQLSQKYPDANTESPYMGYISDPYFMSPHFAPWALVESALAQGEKDISKQHRKILNILNRNKKEKAMELTPLLNHLKSLESLRNNSFEKTFPEVAQFFEHPL